MDQGGGLVSAGRPVPGPGASVGSGGAVMDAGFFIEENEGVRNFVQLTYLMLSSSGYLPLEKLEDAYKSMRPVIHEGASSEALDAGALYYAAMRLPGCMDEVEAVLFGQSESILEERGVAMSTWNEVQARARRRRYLFDSEGSLICFISSKSDLDDLVPTLLAFQVEWNKANRLLAKGELPEVFPETREDRERLVMELLSVEPEGARKVVNAFGGRLPRTLAAIKERRLDLHVRNYETSYCRYRKETENWWKNIQAQCSDLENRPVYFVSSNSHSLINILSTFAETVETEILDFASRDPELRPLIDRIAAEPPPPKGATQKARAEGMLSQESDRTRRKNLLYYLLMRYEQQDTTGNVMARRLRHEEQEGIRRVTGKKTLDIPAQIIDLRRLARSKRATVAAAEAFGDTEAMILNIDYPLGRAAYFILNKLAEHLCRIRGIYVIGKAASLIADRGDILIPSSIVDQHTRNQYFFENCIKAKGVEKFLHPRHSIYDNQKAVTVLGTFMQNREMLTKLLYAGLTDLEMEAGPYFSAVYEIAKPKRYPEDETISLTLPDVDLGIVHYVSDNPLNEDRLDTSLNLDGIDATYAATRAVLERIERIESGEADLP